MRHGPRKAFATLHPDPRARPRIWTFDSRECVTDSPRRTETRTKADFEKLIGVAASLDDFERKFPKLKLRARLKNDERQTVVLVTTTSLGPRGDRKLGPRQLDLIRGLVAKLDAEWKFASVRLYAPEGRHRAKAWPQKLNSAVAGAMRANRVAIETAALSESATRSP